MEKKLLTIDATRLEGALSPFVEGVLFPSFSQTFPTY
jgi:hypothetical protein